MNLYRLIDLNKVKIIEIFDTAVILHWQQRGRYELAGFEYNGHRYVIQIEQKPIPIDELKDSRTAEVSFFRQDYSSDESHSTTHDVDYPFALYGVVANNLAARFHDYEAFAFIILRRHSSSTSEFNAKRKIYFFLADRLSKKLGAEFYERMSQDGFEGIISKKEITSALYKNGAKEALKEATLIYTKVR